MSILQPPGQAAGSAGRAALPQPGYGAGVRLAVFAERGGGAAAAAAAATWRFT